MGITKLWLDKIKIILMEWKQYEPRWHCLGTNVTPRNELSKWGEGERYPYKQLFWETNGCCPAQGSKQPHPPLPSTTVGFGSPDFSRNIDHVVLLVEENSQNDEEFGIHLIHK